MSLLRQCQSHRFLISHTETSQMNTFPVLHAVIVNVKLPSQSKLLGHFCVFLSPQCWCTRFGDWTAINNFERDKGSTRRKKTAFGLIVPTIFVWDCKCRMDWSWMGKPISACMSFNLLKQSQSSSVNGTNVLFLWIFHLSLTSLTEWNFMTDFLIFP